MQRTESIDNSQHAALNLDESERKTLGDVRTELQEIKDLHCPLTEEFLIRFLRSKNNDVKKTVQVIKQFYEVKIETDYLLDIPQSTCKRIYDTKGVIVLKNRDREGRQTVYVKMNVIDPEVFTLDDLKVALYLIMNQVTANEESQKNGCCFIYDFSDLTLWEARRIASQITVKEIKLFVKVFQGAFPAKIKKVYAIHTHFVFASIYTLFKYFLKQKLRDRIVLHRGGNETLGKYFDPDILPISLGGTLSAEDAEDSELVNSALNSFDKYQDDGLKYGYIKRCNTYTLEQNLEI